VLVAPPDTPVPFAPELEDAYQPSVATVRRSLEGLLAY
jgi:pyruvate/2-oxoglutarate/acetoin dehydrogenase E1 component